MKPLVFLCIYLLYGPIVKAQVFDEYSYIDRRVLSIPESETLSSVSIARYIQSNFKTDREKLRAIYAWVTTNIKYDTDSMFPINWSLEHEEKISATLRRRRGVCENYAALFTDIAVKSGFQSFVVNGYTRQHGFVNRAGHSWSAVNLQEEWFLCDPTWDNESRGNTKYFLVNPADFIESHIPFDPLWQLLERPLMDHEFSKGLFNGPKSKTTFNFKDSVKDFLLLDSLQQLEASNRRIKEAGIENVRQKHWVAYNQMKIAGIYGEQDMNLYNSAVGELNKANIIFNRYVQYRNDRFIPEKADEEINNLLDPIERLLSSASKKLAQMGKGAENFQYDTGTIKERLAVLSKRVQEQQAFLSRYLATGIAERERLFYK
ncbi:MAG: transglutaminase-like domain-containing protein [Ferruginibacter sp.]